MGDTIMSSQEVAEMMELLKNTMAMALIESIPSMLIGIGTYILTALSLYTIAKRRGINNPWLAWIPIANIWMLGCISDQYRFVAMGQVKSRRKVLLGTYIPMELMAVAVLAICVSLLQNMFSLLPELMMDPDAVSEAQVFDMLMGPMAGMMVMLLPMLVLSIVYSVFYYIALYDVFKSCEPGNATLYLVLSLLISITLPIFLMVSRNKDQGMPPREPVYQQPVMFYPEQPPYQPPQPPAEPWENKNQE